MKKITLTIIALAIVAVTLTIINKKNENNDITVYVEIIKSDEKIEKEIVIKEDSTFLIELNNEFEIKIKDGFLYKIDFLECYDNEYIAIYVNDKYSNYGISNLKLNDQDKISFIYTKL